MSLAQITMMYELSKPVYNEVLRPLIIEHVKASETEVDDRLLDLCDIIFLHDKRQSQIKLISILAQKLYKTTLRGLAERAVRDTETEVDDTILKICDIVFQYDSQ